jgi:ABC-type bacteriocin/lantibiotic exporter with double-glycine peptidase domain
MLRKQIIDLLEKYANLSGHQLDHFDLHDQKFRYADEYDDSFENFYTQLLDTGEYVHFNFDMHHKSAEDFKEFLKIQSFPIIVFKNSDQGLIPIIVKHREGRKINFIEDTKNGCIEGSFDNEDQLIEVIQNVNQLKLNHNLSVDHYIQLKNCAENEILFVSGFRVDSGLNSTTEKEKLSPLSRFYQLLRAEKKDIFNIYFFAVMIALVNLTLPLGIQAIIGLMSGGLLLESVFILMILVVFATMIAGWLQVQQLSLVEVLQQRVFAKTAFDFAFRIPRLKLEKLKHTYTPELVNRFFDVLNVQKSLPKILIDFTSAIIQIIFGLLLLSLYHPYFIVFGFLVILIIFLVFYFTSKKGLETSIYESKYKYKVVYWLEELGRAVQSFKLAGFANLPMHKTDRLLNKYISYRKKHFAILVKQFTAIIAFKTLITAGLLILGGALVFDRQINLGQFVASEIIIVLVISSVEKLVGSISVVYDMLTALDKIGHVTDLEIESNAGRDVADLDIQNRFELKFENVSYKFPGAKNYSIQRINLSVSGSQKICIAGFNDSGKTTLIKTVAGLFQNYEGVVSLNGMSIRELNPNSYRDIIGDNLSLSDVFEGTIEENITLGRNGILLKDILKACEQVGLNQFIASLEEGLQAEVLPSGGNFPSNVVKKILLARSLVKPPKLMLVDEFFQNVQSSEKIALIDGLFKGNYAMLIISSIPEVMRRSDLIYVMKDGLITDTGTFDALKERRSLPMESLTTT